MAAPFITAKNIVAVVLEPAFGVGVAASPYAYGPGAAFFTPTSGLSIADGNDWPRFFTVTRESGTEFNLVGYDTAADRDNEENETYSATLEYANTPITINDAPWVMDVATLTEGDVPEVGGLDFDVLAIVSSDFNIRCRELSVSPEIESYVLEYASGAHSTAGATMGKAMGTVGFKVDMVLASGSDPEVVPKMGKLWEACGASVAVDNSVSFVPDAAKDDQTASIAFQYTPVSGDSVTVLLKGAMGNCKVVMDELGQPLVAEFEFKGCLVSILDADALTLTDPDEGIPVSTVGAVFGFPQPFPEPTLEQRIARFELDFGNDVQGKYDPADPSGYLGFFLAKRVPRIRINPQLALLANDPVYTRWRAATKGVLDAITVPNEDGLKWQITANASQLLTNGLGDRNGEAINEQEYLLATAGTDLNSEWFIAQVPN